MQGGKRQAELLRLWQLYHARQAMTFSAPVATLLAMFATRLDAKKLSTRQIVLSEAIYVQLRM